MIFSLFNISSKLFPEISSGLIEDPGGQLITDPPDREQDTEHCKYTSAAYNVFYWIPNYLKYLRWSIETG